MELLKVCRRCNIEKPLSEYLNHARMKDGHLNICRICMAKYNHKHYFKDVNKSREKHRLGKIRRMNNLEYKKRIIKERRLYKIKCMNNQEWREKRRIWQKEYRKRNKDRVSVWSKVKRSNLPKIKICSVCGKFGVSIHKHHPDYTLPLWVIYCCSECHAKFHCKDWRKNGSIEIPQD